MSTQVKQITIIPASVALVHFVPRCTSSDIIQLSNTSSTILIYLREIGAFPFLYNRDLGTFVESNTLTTLECEKRLRRAIPSFKWLEMGIGGEALFNIQSNATATTTTTVTTPPTKQYIYRLGDVGGLPKHQQKQILPKYGRLQGFTQMNIAGQRLIGIADGTIALWMQKQIKKEPHRIGFVTLQACSGNKGSSKKKKKKNNSSGPNQRRVGSSGNGCLAVTACQTNPDLIAAVFGPLDDMPDKVEKSLYIFDLCEDLNVPVTTTQFTVQRQYSQHSTSVLFIGKEDSARICIRDRNQYHIFSSPAGKLMATIGDGKQGRIIKDKNYFNIHWHQFRADWSRHSLCRSQENELVVACTEGGSPVSTEDEQENALLHVWNTRDGSDFQVGDASFTTKLHTFLENPETNQLDNKLDANENENENENVTPMGCVLYTCAENRCFMVHSRVVQNSHKLIQGVDMTCRTVVSHWKISSSSGSLIGTSTAVIKRKGLPIDMSIVTPSKKTRILIICDRYEATLHSCGANMMITGRVTWLKPLSSNYGTVLFSGMSLYDGRTDTCSSTQNQVETKGNESVNNIAPFIIVETKKRELIGYGPGIEPANNSEKKKKNNGTGTKGKEGGKGKGKGKGGNNNTQEEEEDSDEDEYDRRKKKKKKKKKKVVSQKAKGVKVRMRCGGGR